MTDNRLRPHQGIKVGLKKTYIYDNSLITDEVDLAKNWASKTDGIVQEEGTGVDYSAKAYAVGGAGTETNNAKYYSEQAASSADAASAAASDPNVVAVGTDLLDEDSYIKSVVSDKSNIDAVAGNITNVNAVAGNATNINAVNANKTNIDKVAGDINRVKLVADDIDSVHTVAIDISNVIDVASNKTNIDTVAGDKSSIDTVAGISSAVSGVADIASDVSAVADNETNINAVNSNKANIDTVASISSNVTTVAGISSSVSAVASNATNIDAVAADLTDITSVASNISNVNAVADNEANINAVVSNATDISSVATNIADVGTVATNISDVNDCAANMADITSASTNAALAKDWATKTDGTVADDEYSSKYYAEQASTLLDTKIDKGYAVNDFASKCITEIPQDVMVELASDGTLTVKSGTKLYVPNGSDVDVYQTTADATRTITSPGTYVICFYKNTIPWAGTPSIVQIYLNRFTSGSTDSLAGTTYHAWYDTTNNLIKRYADNTSTPAGYCCYPICIVTATSQKIVSIDKVFNGAGYVGHHAFLLPGIKGLQPNGFNADSTLKTAVGKLNSLVIKEMGNSVTDYCICGIAYVNGHRQYFEADDISDVDLTKTFSFWYIRNENKTGYVASGSFNYSSECVVVIYSTSGTTVTKFDISPVSGLSHNYISNSLTGVSGYDATKTQTLKHVNGVLTWVTDA